MNYYFLVSCILSLAVWGIHTFMGGPEVAKPLLESSLDNVPKYTNYYCWHIVTGILFLNGCGYGYLAFNSGSKELGMFITILVGFCMLWSLLLNAVFRLRWVRFPQWILFFAVFVPAVLGMVG